MIVMNAAGFQALLWVNQYRPNERVEIQIQFPSLTSSYSHQATSTHLVLLRD